MFSMISSVGHFPVAARILTALFVMCGSSLASSTVFAADLTTSETQVRYAKDAVKAALGEGFALVPGTMSVTYEEPPVVDMERKFRELVGKEKEIYTIRFRVADTAGAHFSGSAKLHVTVAESLEPVPEEDNNTTRRTKDLGTGRMIKVQMITYLPLSSAISARELSLRPIK